MRGGWSHSRAGSKLRRSGGFAEAEKGIKRRGGYTSGLRVFVLD